MALKDASATQNSWHHVAVYRRMGASVCFPDVVHFFHLHLRIDMLHSGQFIRPSRPFTVFAETGHKRSSTPAFFCYLVFDLAGHATLVDMREPNMDSRSCIQVHFGPQHGLHRANSYSNQAGPAEMIDNRADGEDNSIVRRPK